MGLCRFSVLGSRLLVFGFWFLVFGWGSLELFLGELKGEVGGMRIAVFLWGGIVWECAGFGRRWFWVGCLAGRWGGVWRGCLRWRWGRGRCGRSWRGYRLG